MVWCEGGRPFLGGECRGAEMGRGEGCARRVLPHTFVGDGVTCRLCSRHEKLAGGMKAQ